jgi:drug/metabolite transporter (DMT)-like permease
MSFDTIVTATSTALVNISATAQALPWPALLWMGLATTSFTLWIEFIALRNVSASTCALIYTTEPLWGVLFAWHFMGERWGVPGWIGATLILGASVGSQLLTYWGDDDKGDDLLLYLLLYL